MKYYILDENGNTVESDMFTSGRFRDTPNNMRIALTTIGKYRVSTVFLGIDHNYSGEGPPILFETMVFPTEEVEIMRRYCTKDEALNGHEKICEEVRNRI